jgi:hypothetical protein
MKSESLAAILKKASKGLLFPSESDAPLEPFVWDQPDAPTPEALVEDAGMEEGTPTETMTLPAFFRAIPKSEKPKFDALAKVLKEHLSGIQVHKIGEVNLKVYILGKTKDGKWAGLTTEVVET